MFAICNLQMPACCWQVCKRELAPDKYEAKLKKLTKKRAEYAKVAYMIMICFKLQAIPGKLNPEWEEQCATACAVQNLALMATALGLGGVHCHKLRTCGEELCFLGPLVSD